MEHKKDIIFITKFKEDVKDLKLVVVNALNSLDRASGSKCSSKNILEFNKALLLLLYKLRIISSNIISFEENMSENKDFSQELVCLMRHILDYETELSDTFKTDDKKDKIGKTVQILKGLCEDLGISTINYGSNK